MIDADDIIRLEFVRHRTVADAANHGGHDFALFDEVFLTDGVEKTLTDGDFAEFDAQAVGIFGHTGSKKLWMAAIRYRSRKFWKY